MRFASYNVEWFDALFSDDGSLLEDGTWSSRYKITRADQVRALGRVFIELDANAVMIIRGCQTYFRQLGLAGYAMTNGQSAENALRSLRPPPHFKLQDRLQAHLRRWRPHLAMEMVNRLQDIELQLKSGGIDDQLCTAQSLLGICLRAPR